MNANKKTSTAHRLRVAEALLDGIGLNDSIKSLYEADQETVSNAAKSIGNDVKAAFAYKESVQQIDWNQEHIALQLPDAEEMAHGVSLDEFRKTTPCFCIAEVVHDFEANAGGTSRKFPKGTQLCLTGSDYRRINDGQRCMKPATPSFRERYNKYDGENLDGKTLCVWRSGGIGDLMFIRPILCHLKKKHPTCKIIFATKSQYHDLIQYWEDCIDELSDVYFDPAKTIDVADYHLSFEGLIERCADAETTDVHDLFATFAGVDPDEVEWTVPMSAPVDNAFFAGNTEQYVLVQARASSPTRTPFMGLFVEAINQCTARGLRVILADAPRHVRTVEDIRSACFNPDKVVNFAKYTTGLHDMVSLVDNAVLVISPDSAFTHAAAMQGKPNIAFYGPFPAKVRTERYDLCVPLEPEKSNVCPHSGGACFLHAHIGICKHDCACWNHISRKTVRDTVNTMLDAMETK